MTHCKRKNHKAMLAVAITVIAICSIGITGITAYFIAAREAVNSASIGHNRITINENFENPDIEPLKITTVTKQVSVENIGSNPCAVRVKATFSDESVLSYSDIDYDTANWTLSNGYWYYNSVLAPNDGEDVETLQEDASAYETSALFRKIVINRPTQEQVKDFEVYIYAESRNCRLTDNPMDIWK